MQSCGISFPGQLLAFPHHLPHKSFSSNGSNLTHFYKSAYLTSFDLFWNASKCVKQRSNTWLLLTKRQQMRNLDIDFQECSCEKDRNFAWFSADGLYFGDFSPVQKWRHHVRIPENFCLPTLAPRKTSGGPTARMARLTRDRGQGLHFTVSGVTVSKELGFSHTQRKTAERYVYVYYWVVHIYISN